MRIEVNDKLYKALYKMFVFMGTNGDMEARYTVNNTDVSGLVDSAIENLLVKFFNDNGDLYGGWNGFYNQIEDIYNDYKQEELKEILNK